MQVIGNSVLKDVKDAGSKELIRFAMRGKMATGIVIGLPENGTEALVAVLSDPEEGWPTLYELPVDDICMTFGTNWIIEPIDGAESYPHRHEVKARSGLLALTKYGWAISIAAPDWMYSNRPTTPWINLQSMEMVGRYDWTVLFDQWKIWASHEERALPGASPLMEVVAMSKPSRD